MKWVKLECPKLGLHFPIPTSLRTLAYYTYLCLEAMLGCVLEHRSQGEAGDSASFLTVNEGA